MNTTATHTTLCARQAFFRTFAILAVMFTFNGVRAQTDSGALVQDTATYISTDTWSNDIFEEPDGPFLFYFGNGVIVTYEEAAANEIGSKLGIARPAGGRNLVGEFYSIGNYYGGPALNHYLQGYLGSNDKIYRSVRDYHMAPASPLIDLAAFGRYPVEQGGAPKVCRL